MMRSQPFLLRRRPRGVALIIILALLVLIAGLIVGFMRRMGTERSTSAAYAEANRNALLADHAVSLVQAQIAAATKQKLAWASQPGMVRTYKADGDLSLAYKLYSDSAMVSTSVSAADALSSLNNWQNSPAHFVDLNAPIFRTPDGATLEAKDPVYPILDPRAATIGGSGGTAGIKGFEIANNAPGTTTNQPAPMPVRWLYILEDGTTVAPTGSSGTKVTVPGATSSNPIVGRIAFWTDDETAKLNINTAGTGGFWDLPRTFAVDERDRMARYQPTLREFQRYPGHPATTSLWPALGYLFSTEEAFDDFVLGTEGASEPGLSPRLRNGGSLSGTRSASTPLSLLSPAPRLYTSVDELLFDPSRGMHAPLGRGDLEALKFFLTARSNAPEVNLFNLPRMAIWPINSGDKTPSTLDQLIAFCSTINSVPYYFARSNPNSSTADATTQNVALHGYISKLLKTPFPGFGSNTFASKYSSEEVDQITTMIFDYIRSSNLYSSALGATPYSGTSSTSNPLANGSRVGQVTPLKIGDTKGIGRIPVLSKAILQFYIDGFDSENGTSISGSTMAPTTVPDYTAGIDSLAAFKTVKDFFVNTGEGKTVTPRIRAIVYFDAFDPMYGYIFPRYNFDVEVEFSGAWSVNGAPLGFPSGAQTVRIDRDHAGTIYDAKENRLRTVWMGQYLGGNLRPTWMLENYSWMRDHVSNNSILNKGPYPLLSNSVQIHAPIALENAAPESESPIIALPDGPSGTTMNFSGGTVTAKIKVNSEVVQTYVFNFDGFTKPAPDYPQRSLHRETTVQAQVESVFKQLAVSMDFRNRLNQQTQISRTISTSATYNSTPDISLTPDIDTIVSLEPAYGDKRLLAGRSVLTTGSSPGGSNSFVPHIDYANPSVKTAVDVRTDAFGTERYHRARRLGHKPGRILDLPYGMNAMPDIPRRYPTGVPTNGDFAPDFDNGTLHQPDDAYVNRADEGSSFDLMTAGGGRSGNRSFAWYWDEPTITNSAGAAYFNSLTFYSPNKQMSSPVMFGSIPTGVVENRPWQTLLFRPDPGNHPGAAAGMPKDHLLLDLFWMPVVEPYAISEPFSTNGKVNMNYQIMPFSYIHRSTALQGVLHSQEIVTISNSDATKGTVDTTTNYGLNGATTANKGDEYKMYSEGSVGDISSINYRRRLNLSPTDGTLRGFEERFKSDRLFISETEICDIPLIPNDQTWAANFESTYWNDRRLTGDNSREMPYAHLLPRLTTRSNTYTVHYWVQSLRKPKNATNQDEWDTTKDRVVSELRGSRTVERYIDPAESAIPNYSTASDPLSLTTLEAFYRWRVLSNKEFRP